MKYTRNKNSTYASYRARNPHSVDFIAPEGKIANFMNPLDYLDPDMLQQGLGAVRGVAGQVANGAQDLYAQGIARTGFNPAGLADQLGNAARGVIGGENQFLQGQLQGVRNLAGQVGQAASPYLQQAQTAAAPYLDQASQATSGLRQGLQQAGGFLQNAASGIDPVQAGELGLASTGAAAGGIGLGRLARARRAAAQAGQAVPEAIQQVPGMVQRGMSTVQGLPTGAKVGLAAGGVGALGAGAYGLNRMRQQEDAQYSAQSIAQARFNRKHS